MTFNINFDKELENVLKSEDMNEKSLGLVLTGLNTVLLLLTIQKLKKMPTEQQWNDLVSQINNDTNQVASTLADVRDQLKKYGLPAETEQNIFNQLSSAEAKLRGVGAVTPAGSPITSSPVTTSPVTTSPVTTSPTSDNGNFSPLTDTING